LQAKLPKPNAIHAALRHQTLCNRLGNNKAEALLGRITKMVITKFPLFTPVTVGLL
jgi:hypothetical protein